MMDDASSSASELEFSEFDLLNSEEERINKRPRYYCSEDDDYDCFEKDETFPDFPPLNILPKDDLESAALAEKSQEVSTSPTSNSDADPELPRNDWLSFQNCCLCGTSDKSIDYPYCYPCFTWKKTIFPNRPKKKKPAVTELNRSEKQYGTIGKAEKTRAPTYSTDEESAFSFDDTSDGAAAPESTQQSSTNSTSGKTDSKKCAICLSNPTDGLFLHLNSAHLYGCLNCATDFLLSHGSCPQCKRKVFKVVKLFD